MMFSGGGTQNKSGKFALKHLPALPRHMMIESEKLHA
jgi:hypothetical protein